MDPYNPLIFDPNNPFASSHGVVSHLTHPNNAAHAGTAADVFTLNAHPALSIAMSTPELAQVVALQQQQIAELQRQLQAQSNVQQHSSRSVSDVEEKAAINPRPLSHQFPADNFSLSHSLIEPIGSLNSFAPPPAAAFQPNTSAAQQLLEDEGVVDFANLPSAAQQIEQNIMMEDDDARDDTTTPTPFTPQTFENRATPSNSINSSSSSSSSSSDMSEDEEASTSPSASDNEDTPGAYDPNAVFDVKRFIKRRPKQLFMTQAKKWEYLVRWGPPYNSSKHDTWEPDVGVGECKQAIADLERREARARRKKEKQELKEKKKNERKQRKMKGGSPSIASSSSSTTSGGKKRPREDDSSSVSSVSSKKKKTTSPPGSPTTTHDHPHHTHHEIVDDLLLERRKLMERKRSISSISTLTTASAAATSSASNTSSASSVASLEQEEDDSKCHACNDGNTYNNNEIVCCDGCGTWVHQMCYAVDSIPKGDWFCHVCSAPEKRANSNWQPTCIFCPIAGGAMMRVYGKTIPAQKQGQDWAHLACALFMTEVDVETTNNHGREPGIYLNQPVIPIRFNKKCYICGQSASQKTGGKLTGSATIQCWYSSCKSTWFHVLCARKHGLPSGIKDVDMEIVYPDGEKDHIVECIGYAFCAKHCTKKWDDDDFITTKIEIWKRRKEREKAKLRPPPVKRVHIPTYWEMEFAKAGPPKDREEQLSRSLILAQEKAELARKAKEEKKAAKKNEPATPRSSNASSSSAASVVSASNSVKGENEDMMEMDEVREIEAEDEDNSDEEEGQQESSNQNGSTVSFDALSKDTVVSRPTTPIVSSQPPAASSTTTLLPTTADVKPVIRPLVPPAPVVRIPRKSSVIATPAPGLIALGSKAPPKSPVASLTVTALPPSSSRMAPVSSNSSTKEGDAEFSKIMSVLTAAKSLASRSAFLNKYFLSLPKDHPSLTDFGTKFMVSGSPMSGLKTLLIWIIDLRSAKNKSGKLLKDEALLGRQIIDTLLLLHSANPTQVVWAQERDALFKVLSQVCDKESQQLLLTLEKALFGEGGANERLKSSSNFVHVKQEPSHAVDAAATSSSSSSSVITTQADEDEEDDEVQIRHVTTSSSKFHTIELHHRAQPHHHHTAQTAETEVDDPVPEFTSSKPDAAPKKSILKKTLTSVASWDFINKRPRTAPAAADNAQQLLEQTIAATGGPSPSPVPVVVKTEVAPSAAAALALLNQQSVTNPRLRWIPEPGLCAYQPAPSSYIDDHEMDTSEDTVSVQSNPTHAIAQRAHRTSPSAAAAAQQQLRTVPATAVSVSLTDPVDYSMMPSLEAPHSSSQSAVVESHDSPHPSSGNSTEISAVPVVASCVALAAPEPSAATSPPTAFSDTSSTYGKLPDVEIYGDDEKALDYIFANRHCDICQCIVPRYGEAMHLTGKRHQTAKATFLKQIEDEGKAKEQEKQKRLEEEQKNEEKKKNDAAKQHQSANEKGSDNNPRRESESARRNDARYSDRERERDRDSDRSRSREDDRDRERKRDRYRDRDYDNEYSRSRSRDVDRDRERDRDREEEERRRSRSRESYSTSSSRSHSASSSLSPSSSRSGFASRFPSDYDYDRNKDRDQDREYNAYRSSSRSGNASSGSSDRDRDRDQTQSRDREPPHWVSNSLCHFYKNGKNNCRYGDKCRYKHESSASNSQVTNHQQKSVDSKSATVTSSSSSSSASSSSSSSSSVAAAASSSFASSTTASPRSASASIAATTTTIAQTGTTQVDANASREDSNTTTFALSPHTAPISGTPVHALVTDNAAPSAAAPTNARGLVHLAEAGTAVGHTSASESTTISSSTTVTSAPSAPAGVGRCLFYRSQAGCMRGNQCRLQHI